MRNRPKRSNNQFVMMLLIAVGIAITISTYLSTGAINIHPFVALR